MVDAPEPGAVLSPKSHVKAPDVPAGSLAEAEKVTSCPVVTLTAFADAVTVGRGRVDENRCAGTG